MPTSSGGFEQAYNAQASVDVETMLIVGNHLTKAPNDKQEVKPALARLAQLPAELGTVSDILADTGYFSATNINSGGQFGGTPYLFIMNSFPGVF